MLKNNNANCVGRVVHNGAQWIKLKSANLSMRYTAYEEKSAHRNIRKTHTNDPLLHLQRDHALRTGQTQEASNQKTIHLSSACLDPSFQRTPQYKIILG